MGSGLAGSSERDKVLGGQAAGPHPPHPLNPPIGGCRDCQTSAPHGMAHQTAGRAPWQQGLGGGPGPHACHDLVLHGKAIGWWWRLAERSSGSNRRSGRRGRVKRVHDKFPPSMLG